MKMKCLQVLSVLVSLLLVHILAWFPGLDQNTPSDTVCQNALYYSAENVVSAPSDPPYSIVLEQLHCLPGRSMKVQIKSTLDKKIQGVILQMRNLRSQFTVGHFEGLEHAKLYNCDGKNDTLLYWSDSPVSDITLTWVTPLTVDKMLQFVANIFDSSNTLWPNVTSAAIDKGFPPIEVDGCGTTKGCFRYSVGKQACTADTCQYLLTYEVHNDMVHFEMSGDADWIAVGFSSDELMGGDDVLMCEQDDGRGAAVHHYRTNPNYGGVSRETDRAIQDSETEIVNGRLNCRFKRPLKVLRDESSVDLYNDCYHLYTWGEKSVGVINKHTLDSPPTSERKLSLLMSPIDVISGTSGLSAVSRQLFYVTTLYCTYLLHL